MKKLVTGLLSGVFAAVMLATPAFAWHFAVSGTGACQDNGSYKINWTVDNSAWNKNLVITSSNNSMIPVNTVIAKNKAQTFDQTIIDGSKKDKYVLNLWGYWQISPHKKEYWHATANVEKCDICKDTTTTPVRNDDGQPIGGLGGGTTEVTSASEAAPATPVAQVITPAGAVDAGNGGAPNALSLASVAGLIGSVSALGFGLRGLKKQA